VLPCQGLHGTEESASSKNLPQSLRGPGQGSTEGETERGLLVGVSNLTTKKNQTGSQKNGAKKKAVLRDDESLAGSSLVSRVLCRPCKY
jgi:hypothetical protein